MSWTDEKVAKLKELWGKGSTASQIAEIIGGITRNAVIGKAHRLNLSAKIKTRAAASKETYNVSNNNQNVNTLLIYCFVVKVKNKKLIDFEGLTQNGHQIRNLRKICD